MYVGLQVWLETDPTDRERAQIHRAAQTGLRSLVERSETDRLVATHLGKIEGGLNHWLTFVGRPAVSPTNNAAENALRKPVVFRKIIGTLRNPYGELNRVTRDNEMISRAQAVPAVESSG